MYTLGRAYYQAISGLYYLYDDFADRAVHFNHTLQMSASDVVVLALEALAEDASGDVDRQTPVTCAP